jgi:hypothetical protein
MSREHNQQGLAVGMAASPKTTKNSTGNNCEHRLHIV